MRKGNGFIGHSIKREKTSHIFINIIFSKVHSLIRSFSDLFTAVGQGLGPHRWSA
jgi:hypothetical protein